MKTVMIQDGVWVPISEEEYDLLTFVNEQDPFIKWAELTDRGQTVAFNLIRKNVLYKIEDTEEVVYNAYVDLWRM